MHNAIAKAGILKRKGGLMRRKESRFYVLTNKGGLYAAKGTEPDYDVLNKEVVSLTKTSEVLLDRNSSGDAPPVMKVIGKAGKTPPIELEGTSVKETESWAASVADVIDLLSVINNDSRVASLRPINGICAGSAGWYVEPTGRMALYKLNEAGRWTAQHKQEYDAGVVSQWMNEQNSLYSQSQFGGGGSSCGTYTERSAGNHYARQDTSADQSRGGRRDMQERMGNAGRGRDSGDGFAPSPPPRLPSTFQVDKSESDDDTDNLVLRRRILTNGEAQYRSWDSSDRSMVVEGQHDKRWKDGQQTEEGRLGMSPAMRVLYASCA